MEDNRVALCKCDDYEQTKVDAAVARAISLLGGMEQFVKAGQTVVIKANMLMKCDVEKCATTHPSVVEAVGKLAKQAGAARIIIADSAGGPFTEGYMNSIYKSSGLKDVAERNGFEMNANFDTYSVNMPEAKVGKHFLICDCLQQADVIINVCKLKTHTFTGYTNAIKNMFGAIPGLAKVEMHGQFRTLDVFGDFLIDVWNYFGNKIVLNVADAVMAMEVNCGQVRGPVQLSFANSLDPIFIAEHAITRSSVTNEKDAANKEREMGRKYTIPYGLYVAYGFVNPRLAAETGFNEDDLALLWEALGKAFEFDQSAARPAGSMAARKLIVFKHESELGNAPSHKLFELVRIARANDPKAPPRAFEDYTVAIDREHCPKGVTIEELV